MTRLPIAPLAIAAILAAPHSTALAANGLYEPFPREASKRRAQEFVQALPGGAGDLASRLDVDRDHLREGVLLDTSLSGGSTPATARADPGSPRIGSFLAGVLVGVVLLGAWRVGARRAS